MAQTPRRSASPPVRWAGLVASASLALACAGSPPSEGRADLPASPAASSTAPASTSAPASETAPPTPTSSGASSPNTAAKAPDFAEYRRRLELGAAAHTKKDYPGFLEHSLAASEAAPNSPRAIYNVGCAYALLGKKSEAIAAVNRLADLRTYFNVAADTDFDSVKDTPEFQAARGRLEALKTPIARSSVAFTLPQKDLIPEGLAFDPASGAFFVSSVHLRKIVRVDSKGKARDFVKQGQLGLHAVLGIAVDPARGSLWACSTAATEMKGYKSDDKGKASLVELDLATGKLKRSIAPAEPEKQHNFNDLAVDSKGDVFVADPMASAVYRLPAGGSALEVFVEAGRLAAPGGIALSSDGNSMYIADYSRGIARVDRGSREVKWITPPADATLAGIDGLSMDKGDLIGIQNGVRPHRVVRIALTEDGFGARAVTILEMGHPAYDEPTLGVVVGRDFVYVANSQWGSFDKGGVIWPSDRLKEPVILRMPLDAP